MLAVFQPFVEDFLLLQEAVDSLAVKLGAVVQVQWGSAIGNMQKC